MEHDWKVEYAKGLEGEAALDSFLQGLGEMEEATREQQRAGIDRILTGHGGQQLAIEYKTDYKGHKTGNCYIETLSVSVSNKKGWAYTSTADRILYLMADSGTVYCLEPDEVRKLIDQWIEKYRTVRVYNQNYYGEGVLVPVPVIQEAAKWTRSLVSSLPIP